MFAVHTMGVEIPMKDIYAGAPGLKAPQIKLDL